MNFLLKTLFILIFFFNFLFGTTDKETVLQLSWKHQFQFAGYYMAKEKGFYSDLGINVNIKEYDFGLNVTDDTLKQKNHFAVGRSSLILEKLNNKDILLLNAAFQKSPLVLLTNKNINKLKDLKNKRIMSIDEISMASINAMLMSVGIKSNEYNKQKHTFNIKDLIDNKTDAIVAYISNETYLMDKLKSQYNTFSPADFDFNFYSDILFTSQTLYKNNPLLVENFNKASIKGWKYALSNIEETVALILKKYNTQNKTKDALIYEAHALKKLAYLKNVSLGNIDLEIVKQTAQIYRLLGLTSNQTDFEKAIYNKDNKFYLSLTKEERTFLKTKPIIKVHNEKAWAPYNFNESSRARGFSIDYMNLLAKKADLQIEYITGLTWNEYIEKIKENDLDVMLNIAKNSEREKFLNFTQNPYVKLSQSIFMRKNEPKIKKIEDLYGKRFAIQKGFFNESEIRKHKQIKIIEVKNTLEAIKAVSEGKADVMIDLTSVVFYYKQRYSIHNIEVGGNIKLTENIIPLYIGVRKELSVLSSILSKSSLYIDDDELIKIEQKWLFNENNKTITLTNQEKNWIKENPIINVSVDPLWLPIEGFNEKTYEYEGIISEYIKHISRVSGIKFNIIKTDSWAEAVDNVKITKDATMFSAVKKTPKREEYLNFSNSILEMNDVVITQYNKPLIDSVDELENKRVGIVKGYVTAELFKEKYPTFNFVEINTSLDGLLKVSEGEIYAFIGDFSVSRYLINKHGLFSLKIALKTASKSNLHLAVHKDIDESLISILNKSLQTINSEKKKQILNSWLYLKVEEKIDYSIVWKMALILFLIILIILYWNRRLNIAVNEKTFELKNILSSFDENVIASTSDVYGNITYASKAFCEISGYTEDELLGNSHRIVRHEETPKEIFKDMWETIQNGRIWKGEIKNKKKNGNYYWVDVVIEPSFEKEKVIGYRAVRQDITNKKDLDKLTGDLEYKVTEQTKDLKKQLRIVKIADRKQEQLLKEINSQKEFVTTLIDSQEQIIITTDGKILKSCNKAFLEFFAIEKIDDFTEVDDCICDRFEPDETNTYLQKYMGDISWIEYVLSNEDTIHKAVLKRDNTERIFTVTAATLPIGIGELKSAIFTDITEIEEVRKNIEMILSNIMLPVLITSKKDRKILYANEYASKQYELSVDKLVGISIDNVYTSAGQKNEILNIMLKDGYVENLEEKYKTQTGKEFIGLLSVKPIVYNVEESYIGMVVDITEQKNIEHEVKRLHKHTTDSIEYASLIQHALVPEQELFNKYFNDYFTIWKPKDVVGGDIYLFEELRNEDECVLMVIDCTGHGVPGAFVTMLVKAIERQVIAKIENDKSIEVSPAWILSYFNKTMKKLLKQESQDSISNAGFDGGILYYNKKENYIKYAGAETPLFYIQDDELNIIKGNRHSIGYKKSDLNYVFDDYRIDIKEETKIYISTDGYLDQNGGDKGFPFGKKKFKELIVNNTDLAFEKQKEVLLENMKEYMGDEERNDDTTVVGLKVVPIDNNLI